MAGPILQLSADELRSALDEINSVDLLVEELTGDRARPTSFGRDQVGHLTTWHDAEPGGESTELLLTDPDQRHRCLLPVSCLRAFRVGTVAALVARELVSPGVVTAAVIGSSASAQQQLSLVARHLPALSYVSVCTPDGAWTDDLDPRVGDQLDLAGVGRSVSAGPRDAVFGATLVLVTEAGIGLLDPSWLVKGVVVVNTSGVDLPNGFVDRVDEIYVDDVGLLGGNRHRYFVATHGDSAGAEGESSTSVIRGDLARLVSGSLPARMGLEGVTLVEVLGNRVLDIGLAVRLHQVARTLGLGTGVAE